VSLLVLLMVGVSVNLLIIHADPFSNPNGVRPTSTVVFSPGHPFTPVIPEEIAQEYGQPNDWVRDRFWSHEEWRSLWGQHDSLPPDANINLAEQRIGIPFRARSLKAMRYSSANGAGTIWPSMGSSILPPAVTYHPLGLILNPIIYALPIWLIVMGVRWAYITRRSRKRARLGLCTRCAYELAGLNVCPECGNAATA
jgi:hypothetical protein